jgi:hypothetical protein
LHNRGITSEKTVQFPQPKVLVKKEQVMVKETIKKNDPPKAPENVKRGRGRPPKALSEKINTKKVTAGNKKLVGTKGKK